ncbi:MAG: hypothetical protein QG577_904, partial [Thermodesulfobacteriota bacterium]|nr:hypothetical protein [Thermodesulfobacteriota bacterium]
LIPYGSCRLCMVEVTQRGRTRTMPACFNPARDGMQVATQSPKLRVGRRMQLMLLLRSHPLQCPSCDAAGNCTLQELVHEYEIEELPFSRETRYFNVDNDSHFIRHNMNLCIRCGMCVRICDEVQGNREISFIHRGMNTEVSTDFGRPLECEFCGQCVDICPVGAIKSKWLVGTGREFELKKTTTTCSFCSLGCRLTLGQKGGKIVWVSSPHDSPNEGNLCVKGRYGWPYLYSDRRLTKPLIKKNGSLQEVGWDEALKFVADGFDKIKKQAGPHALAALGSERITNEEAYVFNRFVRTVMETPNLDHAGGYAYRALVDGLGPVLGFPATTNSLRDLRKADVILLLGADLHETHPVAKNEIIIATGRHKTKAIVVDSVETRLTERPGMFLPVPPASEHLVVNSMLKVILDEGLFDKAALDLHAEGFELLADSLADYTPDKIGPMVGLNPEQITEAASLYAKAPRAAIVMAAGLNRVGGDVASAQAAANLALVTGHIGKEGSGVYVLGEKANSQGAIDMGLSPEGLPGFGVREDDSFRAKFEAVWGAIPGDRGLSAKEVFEKAISGSVKGLYVVGENPIDTYPNRDQIEQALKAVDFLVVQDMFMTSSAKMASAVLPVASFAEKTGTFTSVDRRIQALRPGLHAPHLKSDLEIFLALAALMGKPSLTYNGPEQIMNEIASLVGPYAGIRYDRLGENGLAWPCVDVEDEGKETLYEGGFPRGKAVLVPAPPIKPMEDSGLPLHLVVGTLKFHSGSMSENSFSLMEVCPEGYAEMNRQDLKTLGISDGDVIRIGNAEGLSIRIKAKASDRALPGIIIAPQHFSSQQVNSLTNWESPIVKIKVEKA